MSYFVIVYDQRSGKVRVEEYPDDAGQAALDRRFELEEANRERPQVEVVMMSAGSREDLERTHRRYFQNLEELAAVG
ncbi:MAG: hypothetical protein ACC726_00780 [Chloroflexota bacterium]